VDVRGAEVVRTLTVFDHGEDRCEMSPWEEEADQSIMGLGLAEACIARQVAYVVRLGDFYDHVCRIHATLHRMVD